MAKQILSQTPRFTPAATPALTLPQQRRRGRGAVSNPSGRFEKELREGFDDGWDILEALKPFKTELLNERARTIITRNESPDIGFDRSINPYRGCEHGCIYCFARPTHAYLGLSPGLDFESKLVVKQGAAETLQRELAGANYRPKLLVIGTNTDPYQPIERIQKVTRSILEVLDQTNHPVGIVTKSALVMRDIDILSSMAARGLAKVAISVTTLDPILGRKMEPRASTPARRLEAIEKLSAAGIPVSVMMAPVIPAVNDSEIEDILTRARAAGASEAGYILLRLPLELSDLFSQWLLEHFPHKTRHVLSLIRSMREGKLNDSTYGKRFVGTGPYAWMIGRRMEVAAAKLGYAKQRAKLRTDLFVPPKLPGEQLSLF